MPAQAPVVKLDVYLESRLVQTQIFAQPIIKLGRLKSAHIYIDDPRISRLHAMIEARSLNDVQVLDLGTVEGTYLNGHRVTRAAVESGDRLCLGPYTVVVSLAGEKRTAAPAPLYDETQKHDDRRILEVMVQWGKTVVDVQHLSETGHYIIGEGPNVNHLADARTLPRSPYRLAEIEDGALLVNIPDDVEGALLVDGQVFSMQRLREDGRLVPSRMPASRSIRLVRGARCRLQFGELCFLVNSVPAASRLPATPLLSGVDRQFVRHLGSALGLHALFLLLVFSIPAAAGSLSMDTFTHHNRFVDVTMIPDQAKTPPDLGLAPTPTASERADEGGADGRESSRKSRSRPAARRHNTPSTAADRARKRAVARALSETVGAQLDTQFSALLQNEGPSAADMAWIGTVGAAAKEGPSPLAVRHQRSTCTGYACGPSVTATAVDTRLGGPIPSAHLGPKTVRKPRIIPKRPTVEGPLPMNVIARIIRQNRGGFRYCYERRLNERRGLEGKVKLEFVIGSAGRVVVAQVTESTLNDNAVESCLARRMQRTQFPRPKGGGTVVVRYPFLFKST